MRSLRANRKSRRLRDSCICRREKVNAAARVDASVQSNRTKTAVLSQLKARRTKRPHVTGIMPTLMKRHHRKVLGLPATCYEDIDGSHSATWNAHFFGSAARQHYGDVTASIIEQRDVIQRDTRRKQNHNRCATQYNERAH
jgi:hypothetical protein